MLKALFFFSIYLSFVLAAPLHLQWNKIDGAIYQIQIAKDRDFKNIIVEQEAKDAEYFFERQAPADLFWRVKFKMQPNGPWLHVSEAGVIEVSLAPLNAIGPKSQNLKKDEFMANFSWDLSSTFPYYNLYLFKKGNTLKKEDNKKEPILNKKFKAKNKARISLSAGDYHWQLIQTDEQGKVLQKSKLFSFSLDSPPDNPAPLSPKGPKSKKVKKGVLEKAVFTWQGGQENAMYEFSLFKKGGEKSVFKPFKVETLSKTEFEIELPAGNYLWNVVQKDQEGKRLRKTRLQKFKFEQK